MCFAENPRTRPRDSPRATRWGSISWWLQTHKAGPNRNFQINEIAAKKASSSWYGVSRYNSSDTPNGN